MILTLSCVPISELKYEIKKLRNFIVNNNEMNIIRDFFEYLVGNYCKDV